LGLFEVEKQVGLIADKLKLPYQWQRLHLVFNIVKLTTVLEDLITEQKSTIIFVSIIVNNKEEWEVEEILNSQ